MKSAAILSPAGSLLHVRIGPPAPFGDEAVDPRRQDRQWHRTELEHRVVEGADVEALGECLLGARSSFENGALAEVVRQRLSRPGDIAVYLGADLALGQGGIRAQIVHRLLARPASGMDS